MVRFKIMPELIYLIFFLILNQTCCVDCTEEEKIIKVSYSEIASFNKISFLEQNRLVRLKLTKEGFKNVSDTVLTRNLANGVVDYLMRYENNEKKINKLAMLLLRPLGEYGSEKQEKILHSQKIAVIYDWLHRSILGAPFLDWILKEVHIARRERKNTLLLHDHLRQRFFHHVCNENALGSLSGKAFLYYQKHLLSKDIPSFILRPSDVAESKKLQLVNLSEPEFGYLHVGLKMLWESQLGVNETWNLNDIEDIGIFIESVLRGGNIIDIELFKLPAKVYYVLSVEYDYITDIPLENMNNLIYEEYFKMIDYSKQSIPFYEMLHLMSTWKNRSTLAEQILEKNNVSCDKLSTYLSNGDSSIIQFFNNNGVLVPLPCIDDIFEEHTTNITNSFRKLHLKILSLLFSNMDEDDKTFIQSAVIDLVQAQLVNYKIQFLINKLRGRVKPPFTIVNIYRPLILEADNIDLLRCVVGNQERVYALKRLNYEIHRIDRNKLEYLRNFNRTDLNGKIQNFFLSFRLIDTIKTKEKTDLGDMIGRLSEDHKNKLYNTLKMVGYEETFRQKLNGFLLSLIPFYTCINEIKNKNYQSAAFSCPLDVISFLPLVGQGVKVANKFGSTLIKASLLGSRIAARQASFYQILRQIGNNFFNIGIGEAAKTLNSRVYQNLGREFLFAIDPGIGFLSLGVMKAYQAIKEASKYLKDIGCSKMETIVKKLVKQSEKELALSNDLISAKVLETKQKILLPGLKQEATVVKIREQNGKYELVRIDPETNIPFGRKFIADPQTGIVELAPISIRKKMYLLKTEGLGGKGALLAAKQWSDTSKSMESLVRPDVLLRRAPSARELSLPPRGAIAAGRMWAKSSTPLTTVVRIKEVYRVDMRSPSVILGYAKGFWKRDAKKYDYNLEQHHPTYRINSSPFVSTSSSLLIVLAHLRNLASQFGLAEAGDSGVIGYVYKIRPNSNFYNMHESYLAARDVCPTTSQRYELLDNLIRNLGDMKEFVALDGFSDDRIMEYAPVIWNGESFLALKWESNARYNHNFDSDSSASDLYTRVAIYKPSDGMYMAVNMVQQVLKVSKFEARSILIKNNLPDDIVMSWIKNYNFNKEEQIRQIQKLKFR